MGKVPLVTEEIDAGARFLGEFQKYMPVQVAFLLRDSEKYERRFYVVSDQITEESEDAASAEAARIIRQMQDPSFEFFRLELIGTDERVAKAVLDLRQRYAGHFPIRRFEESFGGEWADELYIYPSTVLAAAPQKDRKRRRPRAPR